ncbi:unnamed protein product [Brassica oleracea]
MHVLWRSIQATSSSSKSVDEITEICGRSVVALFIGDRSVKSARERLYLCSPKSAKKYLCSPKSAKKMEKAIERERILLQHLCPSSSSHSFEALSLYDFHLSRSQGYGILDCSRSTFFFRLLSF